MNDVKLWAFTLIFCSVAVAVMQWLIPPKHKTVMSYVTGMFILLCVLSPLNGAIKELRDIRLTKSHAKLYQPDTDGLIEKQTAENLRRLITDKLSSSGIFAHDIRIEISITDNAVKIDGVLIVLKQEDAENADSVRREIGEYLGLSVDTEVL